MDYKFDPTRSIFLDAWKFLKSNWGARKRGEQVGLMSWQKEKQMSWQQLKKKLGEGENVYGQQEFLVIKRTHISFKGRFSLGKPVSPKDARLPQRRKPPLELTYIASKYSLENGDQKGKIGLTNNEKC